MAKNLIPFFDLKKSHTPIVAELEKGVDEVINSNWFILGKNLKKFETEYSSFNRTKYCLGVGNGLDALYISLRTLNIGKGDEVIIPSNTYIATALAISYAGAIPILVEPKIETYNINPQLIEEKITKRTKAIIPVHLYGQSCEMDAILNVAKKNKLFIIEDNAQAQGATSNKKLTGSMGDINATSFYPSKNLGALGDAGAITTNHKKYFSIASSIRNYGSTIKYHNEIKGINSRMDELQAKMLSVKLKYLTKWNKEREKIANIYLSELGDIGDIIPPEIAKGVTSVWHLFVIRSSYRSKLSKYLFSKDIGTMIHYPIPIHLQKAYQDLKFKKGAFPVSEKISNTCLSLPIYPGLNENKVSHVIMEIKKFFKR